MNFDTLVSEMGHTLSGGQRQRIILARALYRKAKILFLDEATSNLDVKAEQSIENNLVSTETMRITVAHRGETLQRSGYVFAMQY